VPVRAKLVGLLFTSSSSRTQEQLAISSTGISVRARFDQQVRCRHSVALFTCMTWQPAKMRRGSGPGLLSEQKTSGLRGPVARHNAGPHGSGQLRTAKLLRLPQCFHAFGFLALLIQHPCSIERGACLSRARRRSGCGRRCLRSGCFAHRCRWRMLTCGHGRRLALSGLAHSRRRGMLGRRSTCSLLPRGWLACGLPARIFGRRCSSFGCFTHRGRRRVR